MHLDRSYLALFAATASSFVLQAQHLVTLDPEGIRINAVTYDTATADLYLGVGNDSIGGQLVNGVARLTEGSWYPLSSGVDETDFVTYGVGALRWFHDSLFAAGRWSSIGGLGPSSKNLGRWNGMDWSSIGSATGGDFRLEVTNGDLFLLGQFDSIAGQPIQLVARWNGGTWDDAGMPVPGVNFMKDICWYNGQYYIGGNLEELPNGAEDIAVWDGSDWQPVGPVFWGGLSEITSMEEYGAKLFVGGQLFTSMGDVPNIMTWDGSQWELFHPELMLPYSYVYQMRVIDSVLYAVGGFYLNDMSIYQIMRYDGQTMCFEGQVSPVDLQVPGVDIAGNGDTLYFLTQSPTLSLDTVNYLARWIPANGADTCIYVGTGIMDHQAGTAAQLFYDPATLTLSLPSTLNLQPSTLRIYDPLGRAVLTRPMHGPVSMAALAPGAYLAVLVDRQGQRREVLRFVRE